MLGVRNCYEFNLLTTAEQHTGNTNTVIAIEFPTNIFRVSILQLYYVHVFVKLHVYRNLIGFGFFVRCGLKIKVVRTINLLYFIGCCSTFFGKTKTNISNNLSEALKFSFSFNSLDTLLIMCAFVSF